MKIASGAIEADRAEAEVIIGPHDEKDRRAMV
jgi:hypothetical protein